ncbi:hypothetical protein QBC39DRAFT_2910 [Podospora conica]|nr:hypothetical protein QBC39DRAFT_2910 [Schizothecium conicum]
MRTTAPALRRRNYAQKLSSQRWRARRHAQRGDDTDTDGLDTDGSDNDDFPQPRRTTRRSVTRRSLRKRDESHDHSGEDHSGDDHSDSGDASGEDSGDDSDDDIPPSLVRPAPPAAQAPSPALLPGVGVVPIGVGTGGLGAGVAAPSRATPSQATSSRAAVPVATSPVSLGSGVGSGLGVVVLAPPTAPGAGATTGLPSSTLGAAEDEEITSASDSDGVESGNPSDSDSEDSEDEATKTSSVTTAPSSATAVPALGGSSTGPVTAITPTPADFFVTAPRLSASAAPTATGVAGSNGGDLPTLALPEISPQVTPPTGLGELQGGEAPATNGAVTAERSGPNAGAAAGIVIGVLAAIGLMVGLAFAWRKWQRDGKVMPMPLFWRKSGNDDYPQDIKRDFDPDMIPILPPPNTFQQPKKTNSEMMDGLMQATYRAENGDRSTQGTFPNISNQAMASDAASQRAMDNVGPGFVQQGGVQQARGPGFMDETAYTALAGPPTPVPTKPVQRWLEDVKTPRSSFGGVKWPVSAVPKMPTMQVPFQSEEVPVGKPRDEQFLPPQPSYAANNPRYTTTTATTSSTEDFWFKK